jgi:hypothetical protein
MISQMMIEEVCCQMVGGNGRLGPVSVDSAVSAGCDIGGVGSLLGLLLLLLLRL